MPTLQFIVLCLRAGLAVGGLLAAALAAPVANAAEARQQIIGATGRERTLLDSGWRFHLGDISQREEVIAPEFDDHAWQEVRLPHDYVIAGTYRPPNPADDPAVARAHRGHAYLPLEPAWYRRHLSVPESVDGKTLRLDFEGAFRDCEVWLNGEYLGRHEGGYTPFSFAIARQVHAGDNVLVVRVDPRQREGWWYEGGGIYRHVWLTTLEPLHIAAWGTYVVATVPGGDHGAADTAELTIQTTLENDGAGHATCSVVSEIIDPDGNKVVAIKTDAVDPARGSLEVKAIIPRPRLWSLETPQLYQLRTTVLRGEQGVDSTTTTFGIRTVRFDPAQGFFLNGRRVAIHGLALHQDFAGVGLAVPDGLQAWRVAQLKKSGANALRTAHNPPNESLLDACDRLGVLVMDENRHFGDTFAPAPAVDTPAKDLSELATMIRRDRNHPSIIMWSMGNEGGKIQGAPEGAAVMAAMKKVVHRYDTTRPVTYAMNAGWLAKSGVADHADIIGVNYNPQNYDAIHGRHPDKLMFGSETSNEKTTRGQYADNRETGLCSAYNLSDKTWQAIAERPFMAGAFTWTGMDYKGEPNPFGWPAVSNNTGIMDRCGFPKDKFYYFQSCWSEQPMVHLVPDSWTWPGREGQPIRVLAFSNAAQVELFLNERSLGTRDVPRNGYAEWNVPYQPGELRAQGTRDGSVVATTKLETTGAPARLVLSSERTTLRADSSDAVVVPVAVLDAKGRLVPDASNRITFQITGGGRILGVGNGNPADHDPEKADNLRAFHGRAIVVLLAGDAPATLRLTATSPGLPTAEVTLTAQ